MVFEFHHLKLPGAIAHPTQRPCLEDVLLLWGGCALWPGAHSQSGSRLSKHGFHSGSPSRWADSAKTMYRTHAAFEGVGAADSISLDCAFLRGRMNPLGAETMLRTLAVLRRVRAPPPTHLDFNCAKHGLYLDGVLWGADLTGNHAYRFCCLSGFRCRLHDLSCCISSKHGVWLWWAVSPGVLWPAEMETMLSKRAAWLWCWCGLLLPNRSPDRLTLPHTC